MIQLIMREGFKTIDQALAAKQKLVALGYDDASVSVFCDRCEVEIDCGDYDIWYGDVARHMQQVKKEVEL